MLLGGAHVTRVGEQEVGRTNRFDVVVVLAHARADLLVLAEQLQELEASVVHVVVLAAYDEISLDRATHASPTQPRN